MFTNFVTDEVQNVIEQTQHLIGAINELSTDNRHDLKLVIDYIGKARGHDPDEKTLAKAIGRIITRRDAETRPATPPTPDKQAAA